MSLPETLREASFEVGGWHIMETAANEIERLTQELALAKEQLAARERMRQEDT